VKQIKIHKITFKEDLYPRINLDDDTVNKYRRSLSQLPPIVVNEDYILIDGYHRLIAHKLEGKKEIKAKILDIPEEDIFLEAVRRNARHGKQLTNNEKKKIARDWLKNDGLGEFDSKQVANELSVSRRVVNKWVKDIRDKKKEERKEKAVQLYLDYYNYPRQKDVAEELGVTQPTVGNYINERTNSYLNDSPAPDSLKVKTIWEFQQCDPQYGMNEYAGRMPGQIIENLLYYYTEPFDLVLDPMAGSGTTVDVCKAMLRRYLAFDINPIEDKGIHRNNVLDGIPLDGKNADLIILDPPYWKQKQGEYTEEEKDLSQLSLKAFYEAIQTIAEHSFENVKEGGYVAFIISDARVDGKNYDLTGKCKQQFYDVGFSYEEEIVVPYKSASSFSGGAWQKKAKEQKFLLRAHRLLTIWKK